MRHAALAVFAVLLGAVTVVALVVAFVISLGLDQPECEGDIAPCGAAVIGSLRLAAADRGYWSTHNEEVAAEMGVKHVVLPARGPLSAERAVREKKRWFRRGQAWRAGIEPRIATLKHRFGWPNV